MRKGVIMQGILVFNLIILQQPCQRRAAITSPPLPKRKSLKQNLLCLSGACGRQEGGMGKCGNSGTKRGNDRNHALPGRAPEAAAEN